MSVKLRYTNVSVSELPIQPAVTDPKGKKHKTKTKLCYAGQHNRFFITAL